MFLCDCASLGIVIVLAFRACATVWQFNVHLPSNNLVLIVVLVCTPIVFCFCYHNHFFNWNDRRSRRMFFCFYPAIF